MRLESALMVAKRFIYYRSPGGLLGSFEPLKASKEQKNGRFYWIIKCKYTKGRIIKVAEIVIQDSTGEIIGFEILP